MSRAPVHVIVDFDGTLTVRDGDFVVADALLGPGRHGAYLPLAHEYEQLRISIREYLEGYLALLDRADPIGDLGRAGALIPFRDGTKELVDRCRDAGWELRIASEGLDAYIGPALEAQGLHALDVACNRLVIEDGRAKVLSALGAESCSRCLTCKASHVRRAREKGARVAVVGNGTSDLCAARLADLVVARDSLERHCAREGIPFVRWESLADVGDALSRWAGEGA